MLKTIAVMLVLCLFTVWCCSLGRAENGNVQMASDLLADMDSPADRG